MENIIKFFAPRIAVIKPTTNHLLIALRKDNISLIKGSQSPTVLNNLSSTTKPGFLPIGGGSMPSFLPPPPQLPPLPPKLPTLSSNRIKIETSSFSINTNNNGMNNNSGDSNGRRRNGKRRSDDEDEDDYDEQKMGKRSESGFFLENLKKPNFIFSRQYRGDHIFFPETGLALFPL